MVFVMECLAPRAAVVVSIIAPGGPHVLRVTTDAAKLSPSTSHRLTVHVREYFILLLWYH